MQPRFTIIQGGLSQTAPGGGPLVGRRPSVSVTASGWRVALRRPSELRQAEIEEWRALAARTTNLDPFADPDFLQTAALNRVSGQDGSVVFALTFSEGGTGIERLHGVVPLTLPLSAWAGTAAALWQAAPLAPRPIAPVFACGMAADAVAAVLGEILAVKACRSLRLSDIATGGDLLAALRSDVRFQVADRPVPVAIPRAQIVRLGRRKAIARVERITAADRIGDAVERLLSAEARLARRPLRSDIAAAATVRAVSRLFARRGLIEVELHVASGEVAAGAIRLGRVGERVLWWAVDLDEALPVQHRATDIEVALAGVVERSAAIRLVVS